MKIATRIELLFIVILFPIIYSCNSLDEVGYSLLSDETKLNIEYSDSTVLNIKNELPPDSLNSYRVSHALIGNYVDPVFGKSTAEFVTEFRPSSTVYFDDDTYQVDSFKLFLAYSDTADNASYGNSLGDISFSIYQLNQTLDTNAYASNFDLAGLYDDVPIVDYTLNLNQDTNFVEIDLPISMAEQIVALDSLISFTDFKESFPGLYFKVNSSIDGGITRFDFSSAITKMYLYYSKSDTVHIASFSLDQYCIHFNLFNHEYDGTKIIENTQSANIEDSIIYLQSMNGVRATISIADPSSLYGKIINSAELVVPVYQESDYLNFPPIKDLILLSLDNDGNLNYISEYSSSGQLLNEETLEYKFNITRYIQTIANQADSIQPLLYLASTYDKTDMRRVIIDNRENSVKLNIKYINQK